MRGSPHEHALLAYRWLNRAGDRLWTEFPRYWMAFNALYNAVRDEQDSEVTAVTKVVGLFIDQGVAQACLDEIGQKRISELTAIPPGDDRLDPHDPNYRKKTAALVSRFYGSRDPVEQLATLMAIVYQVRCNLVHGSKDPEVMRDQTLVSACTPILEVVVPRLEDIMERHHDVPRPGGGTRFVGGTA